MPRIETLLYEYGEPYRLLFEAATDEGKRELLLTLERELETIWKNRDYYGAEDAQHGSSQQFLSLDYRTYALRANQYVGVIQTSDIRLTLLPKLFRYAESKTDGETIEEASRDLLYLLSYAAHLKPPMTDAGPLRERRRQDFFELFTYLFASTAWKTLGRGLYRTYHTLEDDLPLIRGKIHFADHVRHNLSRSIHHRVSCRYDQFQEDNRFNRVLKYVTRCLLQTSRDAGNQRLLRNILAALVNVGDERCSVADTHGIVFNHMQREWTPILHFCQLFLRGSLISLRSHSVQVFCFLLDMNVLFEGFVGGFLKRHFPDWRVEEQKADLHVASTPEGRPVFQMYHDILLTKGERVIVLDTKYKPTDFSAPHGGIAPADVYQLTTYAVRRGTDEIVLLYPRYAGDSGPKSRDYVIRERFSGRDIRLRCCTLDFTSLPEGTKAKDTALYSQFAEMLSL